MGPLSARMRQKYYFQWKLPQDLTHRKSRGNETDFLWVRSGGNFHWKLPHCLSASFWPWVTSAAPFKEWYATSKMSILKGPINIARKIYYLSGRDWYILNSDFLHLSIISRRNGHLPTEILNYMPDWGQFSWVPVLWYGRPCQGPDQLQMMGIFTACTNRDLNQIYIQPLQGIWCHTNSQN